MAKTRQQKTEELQKLTEKIGQMKAAVFTNYDGLSVNDAVKLRDELREQNVDYIVSKRSLIKLAMKENKLSADEVDQIPGGLGLALGYEDEITPAKLLAKFSKAHPEVKLVGGIFNGELIDAAKVAELAKLPGKEELMSKLVWLFNYPTSGLVNALAGNMRNLLYALKAIQENKA